MAKSEQKEQREEPQKPRNPEDGSPQSRNKGDGLAHDVGIIEVDLPNDLERNPGIGASKGTTMSGANTDDLSEEFDEADNTFKGDVENDAGLPGTGVDPNRRGRENK